VYTIILSAGSSSAVLIVDGQETIPISGNQRITVRRAPVSFGLVKVPGRSYYQTLRDKLRWGTQPNYRSEPLPRE
jgi:NAD+ kinase